MAKRVTIELMVMVAIGLLLGLLGPFGTFAAAPGLRILYWILWLVSGYALFRPAGIVARWLCEATGLPSLAGTLLALLIAAFPLTLLVTMTGVGLSFSDALRWRGFWQMYGYIGVVSGVVWLVMTAVFGRTAAAAPAAAPAATDGVAPVPAPASPPAPQPPPPPIEPAVESTEDSAPEEPPRFERRLPPGFGPLLALKGEDHYVRAIGAAREALLLIRMSDAIAELPESAGLRVHRSWWVARDAVARVERDGRTARLILTNGTEAPVSRDSIPRLRAAGWL